MSTRTKSCFGSTCVSVHARQYLFLGGLNTLDETRELQGFFLFPPVVWVSFATGACSTFFFVYLFYGNMVVGSAGDRSIDAARVVLLSTMQGSYARGRRVYTLK